MSFSASEHAFRFHDWGMALNTLWFVVFGGILAFFMELLEFYIVTAASSLTLSIVGITKVRREISISFRNISQKAFFRKS